MNNIATKFITCPICGEEKYRTSFRKHLLNIHNLSYKEYYDTYVDTNSHKCPYCDNECVWNDAHRRYYKTCSSTKCYSKYRSEHNGGGTPESLEKIRLTKAMWSDEKKKEIQDKTQKTCMERYGASIAVNRKDEDGVFKRYKTCIKKYGIENPAKLQEIKDKAKSTKLERYGNENYNNIQQISATCLTRYGVNWAGQIEEGKVKSKKTRLERYGAENYVNIEKHRETIKEKYGVTNISEIEQVKQKRTQTMLERFGVPTNLMLPQNRSFLNFFKTINGKTIYFDSIPEVLFYYWALENGKDIKREPIKITYLIDGREHVYLPDFEMDGQLYEIKNDDCVNEDNIVLDFMNKTPLLEKTKSMMGNNVIIIKESEIYDKYLPSNSKDLIEEVRNFRKNKNLTNGIKDNSNS